MLVFNKHCLSLNIKDSMITKTLEKLENLLLGKFQEGIPVEKNSLREEIAV